MVGLTFWAIVACHSAPANASACVNDDVAPAQPPEKESSIETVIALQANVPLLSILNHQQLFLSGTSIRWVRWDRSSFYEENPTWAH
jgi:hypothetical protein